MALYTQAEEGKRAAAYLLSFEASTGYILPDDKKLYHNNPKAVAALKKLMSDARKMGAASYGGSITELFRDKDSGQFLPAVGNPGLSMHFPTKK